MENKVYYGKYCLKHWIDLILKKNIVLPEYQRHFVWKENDVKTLIETFKKKQFVPPVTIGAFKLDNATQNLILDGQQRLTSVLLAYMGFYPDVDTYKTTVELFSDDNGEEREESEEYQPLDNILKWNFNSLTEKGSNKEDINRNIVQGNYKPVEFGIDEEFLKSTFLGFSYLVPQIAPKGVQQRYYSSVFRNINIKGKTLLPQESRASLYFLDKDLKLFFTTPILNAIVVAGANNETKADFVRYVSMLSQHHKDGNPYRVARGYKSRIEKYYEEYIYAAVNDNDSRYGKFSEVFLNKEFAEQVSDLENHIKDLEIEGTYNSIIDLDVHLFGLIYQVIFNKQKIDIGRQEELKVELNTKISEYRRDNSHKRSPNNLGMLRTRIDASISIYSKYILNETP